MEDFCYRGKVVKFSQVTGEVLSSDKFSETHVSSQGGGGLVFRNGGYISAPTIDSESITNHDFWIKTEDGLEKSIQLRGVDVPLRPGQKITLISACKNGVDVILHSILVNHSAREYWFINSAEQLNKDLKLEYSTGKSLLIGVAIGFGVIALIQGNDPSNGQILASFGLGLGAAIAFIIHRWVKKERKISQLTKNLNSHLESLIELAHKNY
jgi:hypothetical protein